MSAVVPWWRRVPWTDWVAFVALLIALTWLVWAKVTGQHRWQAVVAGTLSVLLVGFVAAAGKDAVRRRRAETWLRQGGDR